MASEREYFRVPCEFQIRVRTIEIEELNLFVSQAMRPSPYSILRMEVETQLSQLSFRDETKVLLEKAFQLLINMDQRLERMEETLGQSQGDIAPGLNPYQWTQGDLGAGGLSFDLADSTNFKVGNHVMIDCVLPAMPEFRFVAAGKIVAIDSTKVSSEFVGIHADDREYIHRFVMARQREQLRGRTKDR